MKTAWILAVAAVLGGCGVDEAPTEQGSGAVTDAEYRGSEVRAVRLTARIVFAEQVFAREAHIGIRYEGGAPPPWVVEEFEGPPVIGTALSADLVVAETVEVDVLHADEVHARKIVVSGVERSE